jgi:hypothetical protein
MSSSNLQTGLTLMIVLTLITFLFSELENYCVDIKLSSYTGLELNETESTDYKGFVHFINPLSSNCGQGLFEYYKFIIYGCWLFLMWYLFYPVGKS